LANGVIGLETFLGSQRTKNKKKKHDDENDDEEEKEEEEELTYNQLD